MASPSIHDLIATGFRSRSSRRSEAEEFDAFYTSATPIGRSLDGAAEAENSKIRRLPTIAFSLTLLLGCSMICAAVSIWACMYAINSQGLNGVSSVIQNQTMQNMQRVFDAFKKPAIDSAQILEEYLRLGEVNRPGFIASYNWSRTAWQLANQFGGSAFCGFEDGSYHGYRLYSVDSSVTLSDTIVLQDVVAGSNVLNIYNIDEQGRAVSLLLSDPNYNVTTRPWYVGGQMMRGFYFSKLYQLYRLNRVGFTASMPIMADFQQPIFAPSEEPFSSNRSLQSNVSSIYGKQRPRSRKVLFFSFSSNKKASVGST